MNSIFYLEPRRTRSGIWVFDDPSRGLIGEPFVGETNLVIDEMAVLSDVNISIPDISIALLFSNLPFMGHQCELRLIKSDESGSTYYWEDEDGYDRTPWLCPAMFKYFPTAPKTLYGAVKSIVTDSL